MGLQLVEIKYTLGPRKIYESGGTVVIALGKKFKPLVGRYAFITVEVLKEDKPSKPKKEHNPP